VPAIFGTIVSRRMATLHELDTVYGTQDVYDMLEIIAVDNANTRILNKPKD
jgi:4-diphosphocytidyl-2C-methyl-D-erythritol kinase